MSNLDQISENQLFWLKYLNSLMWIWDRKIRIWVKHSGSATLLRRWLTEVKNQC
jgi:hypothetical protein